MSKKISLGAAIGLAFFMAAVTFAITWMVATDNFDGKVSNLSQRYDTLSKLTEIDALIREKYVGDMDDTELKDAIARGYVSGMSDDYAAYYSAEELTARQNEQEGYLTGIGIAASETAESEIEIISVYSDSPASEAGLVEGDIIIKVDNQLVSKIGFDQAVENLKGDAGTKVSITVRSGDEEKDYELTRAQIELQTVAYRMIDGYGYIQISSFKQITVSQFQTAINFIINQGAKGIVFDVRNNSGGTLKSVVEIMDIILPEGTLGHYEYKDGSTEELGTSDAEYIDLPMMVLVNKNTASAAELFAANLRDFGMAELVGVQTYGKGVSQSLITLSDGSGISFTTAYFYPAKSDNFNGVGLKPDYKIQMSDENQELYDSDSLEDADDEQLQNAIQVLNE